MLNLTKMDIFDFVSIREPTYLELLDENLDIKRKLEIIYCYGAVDMDKKENVHKQALHNNHLNYGTNSCFKKYLENSFDLDNIYDIACACLIMAGSRNEGDPDIDIINITGYQWCLDFLKIGVDRNIPKFIHQEALLVYYRSAHAMKQYNNAKKNIQLDEIFNDTDGYSRMMIDKACELQYLPSIQFKFKRFNMTREERQKLVDKYLDYLYSAERDYDEQLEPLVQPIADNLLSVEIIRYLSGKIKSLERTINDMIIYAPNGPEFDKAKEHWDSVM